MEVDAIAVQMAMMLVGAVGFIGGHQRNTIGNIDRNEFRGIFSQFLQARLLQPQSAHGEVGAAIAHLHHLLRGEFVGFRTGTGRNEGGNNKFVAGYIFHEIA